MIKFFVLFLITHFFIVPNLAAQEYSFAFVPQQSAKKLAKKWVPILNYLSEKTGDSYKFVTAKNIPTFEKRVLAQAYDIAYMNPYHFVTFHQQVGYQALAKQRDKQIKGILVVSKDSPINSLSELANQNLAFPAPAAFAASILPRAELNKQNIEFTPKYVSSHDSVYLNVSRGFMVAGGGVNRTFNNTAPEVKAKLKVLWTTSGYTPHAFAVKQTFPKEAAQKLQQALISMNSDPAGQALLKTVNFNGMAVAKNEEWNDVKALNISALLGTE